jgi:hypothetical protein
MMARLLPPLMGARVQLGGLGGAAHLNGRQGCVRGGPSKGRFSVEVDGEPGIKMLKPANLTAAAAAGPPDSGSGDLVAGAGSAAEEAGKARAEALLAALASHEDVKGSVAKGWTGGTREDAARGVARRLSLRQLRETWKEARALTREAFGGAEEEEQLLAALDAALDSGKRNVQPHAAWQSVRKLHQRALYVLARECESEGRFDEAAELYGRLLLKARPP